MTTEEKAPEVEEPERVEKVDHGSIWEALEAIRDELPEIDRNGEMQLGGRPISFTKIDDVRRALRPLTMKHRVMLFPYFVEQDTILRQAEEPWTSAQTDPETKLIVPTGRPIRDGRIPTTNVRVQVTYDWKFVHIPTGQSEIPRTIGEAMDTSSDKATNKATTAAVKRLFMEVFQVIDPDEVDIEADNPDDRNRAATTDRRQGGDRGQQARATAADSAGGNTRRQAPQRSVSTNPRQAVKQAAEKSEQSGEELPAPNDPPEPSSLDRAKARVKAANDVLKLSRAEVDALAAKITGYKERGGENGWITKVTAVNKLADELEARLNGADVAGTE